MATNNRRMTVTLSVEQWREILEKVQDPPLHQVQRYIQQRLTSSWNWLRDGDPFREQLLQPDRNQVVGVCTQAIRFQYGEYLLKRTENSADSWHIIHREDDNDKYVGYVECLWEYSRDNFPLRGGVWNIRKGPVQLGRVVSTPELALYQVSNDRWPLAYYRELDTALICCYLRGVNQPS